MKPEVSLNGLRCRISMGADEGSGCRVIVEGLTPPQAIEVGEAVRALLSRFIVSDTGHENTTQQAQDVARALLPENNSNL